VSLGGVSKSLGAPGLRIGWLTSPSQTLLDRCASLKDFTTICSAAPAECLATMVRNKKLRNAVPKHAMCRRLCFEETNRRMLFLKGLFSTVFTVNPCLKP
jgi:aspartate/methionine/tyrosine aminotransferase